MEKKFHRNFVLETLLETLAAEVLVGKIPNVSARYIGEQLGFSDAEVAEAIAEVDSRMQQLFAAKFPELGMI